MRSGGKVRETGELDAVHMFRAALGEALGDDGQPFGSAQGRPFRTQHVVGYQEEARHGGARSYRALIYDHPGAIGA